MNNYPQNKAKEKKKMTKSNNDFKKLRYYWVFSSLFNIGVSHEIFTWYKCKKKGSEWRKKYICIGN